MVLTQYPLDLVAKSAMPPLRGGENITFSSTNYASWSSNMYLEPVHDMVASDNWVSLAWPASVLDHNGIERLAAGQGILLNNWDELWFIHSPGEASSVGNSWRVAGGGSTLSNQLHETLGAWLVAANYDGTLTLSNGRMVRAGGFPSSRYGSVQQSALEYATETRNMILTGGGYVTFFTSRLSWSARFIFIPAWDNVTAIHYVDLPLPASGVLNSAGTDVANVNGILFSAWDSLWVRVQHGSVGASSVTYHIVNYTDSKAYLDSFYTDPNAFMICSFNGDNNALQFRNGLTLQNGAGFDSQVGTQWADVSIGGVTALADQAMAEAGTNGSPNAMTPLRTKNAMDTRAWKPDVEVLSVTNLSLSGLQTVEGYALGAGDRIAVSAQTNNTQNGIYLAATGAWTRAPDLDSPADFANGVTFRVRRGTTVTPGQIYYLNSARSVTIGTTAITFAAQPGAVAGVADAAVSQKGAVFTSVAPTTATSPTAIVVNDPILEQFLLGLGLTWDSATTVGVEQGSLWIPGSSRVINIPTRLTLAPALTANTVYYLYVFLTGSTPTLEASTTAPVAYKGLNARQKTGDATRRYVGMVRVNAAGTALMKWVQAGEWVHWQENSSIAPLNVISTFPSGTTITASCTGLVPPGTRIARITINNFSGGPVDYSNSFANLTLGMAWNSSPPDPALSKSPSSASGYSGGSVIDMSLDANLAFTADSDGAYNIDLGVSGYQLLR
jgi:hypothetical protein